MPARPSLTLLAAALLLAVSSLPVSAAPGNLDTSFSANGQVTTAYGTDAQVDAVAMQGNKIVAGGMATKATEDMALVRYTSGGNLDGTFGRNGRVRIDFGDDDAIEDLVVLGNGKILAVGVAEAPGGNGRFGIVRFTPDGKLDKTFGGGDGVVKTGFGELSSWAAAVVPLSNGRFAVAGGSGDPGGTRLAVARYRADGRLDRRFSRDGKVLTGFWSGAENSAVVDLVRYGTTDLIVAVVQTMDDGGAGVDVGLARYLASGKLDPLFGGGDGKAVRDFYTWDYVNAATLQRNNFLLVGGYADIGGEWDAYFVRFNASGNLDSAWGGGDAVVSHDIGGTALEYWDDLVGAGAKTIAVGQVDGDAAVIRILKSGALDSTFGSGGAAITPFAGGDSLVQAVTLQSNGRIVAGGRAPATLAADGFAVERLLA